MSSAQIMNLSSGGRQLISNGHVYYKKYSVRGKTYWRCSSAYKYVCNATAITRQSLDDGIEVVKESEHTHPPAVQGDDDMMTHDDVSEGDADYGDGYGPNVGGGDIFSYQDFAEDEAGDSTKEHSMESSEEDSEKSSKEDSDESSEEEVDFVEWQPWHEDSDEEDEEGKDSEEEVDEEQDGHKLKRLKFKRYKAILRALRQVEPPMKVAILSTADKGLICFLCEICLNILNSAIHLNKREVNMLRPFTALIRGLASGELTWQEKQEALSQDEQDPSIPLLLNIVWEYL